MTLPKDALKVLLPVVGLTAGAVGVLDADIAHAGRGHQPSFEYAQNESQISRKQRLNDNRVRRALRENNLLDLNSTLVGISDGNYDARNSADIWDIITGAGPADRHERPVKAHLVGVPGARSGTFHYNRDVFGGTLYREIEYANMGNIIGTERGVPFTNDELMMLAMANVDRGEGTLNPNKLVVLRYNSDDHRRVVHVSSAPNGGDLFWDLMYRCPDKGVCMGTNGSPIAHIAKGSQYIDLPGPDKLVHLMIEGCERPKMIKNPATGRMEPYAGHLVIPKILYGGPALRGGSFDNRDIIPIRRRAIVPDLTDLPDVIDTVPPYDNEGTVLEGTVLEGTVLEGTTLEEVVKNPEHFLGVRGTYMHNNFLPSENTGIGSIVYGKKVSDNAYIVFGLGYGPGGDSTSKDPNSRTTEANPDDPNALTSKVDETVKTSAHLFLPEVGMLYQISEDWAIELDIGVPVVVSSEDRSVNEQLLFPNGTVAEENSYDRDTQTSVDAMGSARVGVQYSPHENVAISVGGFCATDFQGQYGCGGSLDLRFRLEFE